VIPVLAQWLGLPVEASAQAPQLDRITVLVHGLMAVMFVGWLAYFVYVLIRFRRRRQPVADYLGARGRWSKWTEAAVAIAEIVLLSAFSIPAWASRVHGAPANGALVVRVVAQQFSWTIHYAGPDGEFGRVDASLVTPDNPAGLDRRSAHAADDVVTIDDMHLPMGQPVIVELTSRDMVHSFGVPAMRVKQDVIPGMTIPVWFTPTLDGTYDIACSQLCGLGHYRMRAVMTVVSPKDFSRWLDAQR
jgi:cytochrome c oxidase subunit 2